jgi:excisionase family DNA binding protein
VHETVVSFPDEYVSVPQAAALLRRHRTTMWRMVKAGEVPSKRIGRDYLISVYELRKYWENADYRPADIER